MTSAGSIFVDLLLNDARFSEGAKRASKNMREFEKSVTEASKIAAGALAVAAGALTALTIKQLGVIDSTNKLARSLGVANESFQAIALVADEAGVEQEKLGTLFTKAQKSIVEAAKGSDSFEKAFARLNLRAEELINLRPDEQFQKILEALSEIENPTLRNATALEIFGRSGRDVVLMLEDFGAKTEEARQFNEKFNISVSAIDGRKVEEANDAFARLGKAIGGLGNTIAIELAPIITEVSNQLLNAGIDGEDFGNAVRRGINYAAGSIDNMRITILGLRDLILELGLSIDLFVLDASKGFFDLAEATREFLFPLQEARGQAELLFMNINQNAQANAQRNIERIGQLNEEAANFKYALEGIEKIQKAADDRARNAEGKGSVGGIIDPEELKDTTKAANELNSIYEKNRGVITGLDSATLKYQGTIEDLNRLVDAGVISQQSYNDAVVRAQDELEKASSKSKVWAFDMEAAGKRASENIQQSLADYLFNPADKGFKGMLKGFVDVLRRMAAEAASANILKGLFGEGGITGGGGGLGSIFGNLLGNINLGGFKLPGFATGIDMVPRDMAAIIHKDEAVLNKTDAAAWRSGGGGNTYYIDAKGADQGAVRRIEQSLLALAGPGVIEQRVSNAQQRGAL